MSVDRSYPQPKAVRDRNGEWRLPDIHPPELGSGTSPGISVCTDPNSHRSRSRVASRLCLSSSWRGIGHPSGAERRSPGNHARGCISAGAANAWQRISQPADRRISAGNGCSPYPAFATGTDGHSKSAAPSVDPTYGGSPLPHAVRCAWSARIAGGHWSRPPPRR